MSSSSAQNGLAKLTVLITKLFKHLRKFYKKSACFLWSLNFFINLNQGLQFYSHDLKASWNLKHIRDLCRREPDLFAEFLLNYLFDSPWMLWKQQTKKKKEGNCCDLSLQHYLNSVQDWQDTSLYETACVQRDTAMDIYKLCVKLSVQSPRDKRMLFAMVWNEFSSFLS